MLKSIERMGRVGLLVAIVIGLAGLSSPAFAKGGGGGSFRQNHPRRAETLGRDRGLARQMNRNYGELGGHYGQLQRQDSAIRRQEQGWAKQNGGYLTKGEQGRLNREENHLQREVNYDKTLGDPQKSQFAMNHPRRAEVLNRDSRLGGSLNADYGKLDGNFGALKQDQRSIRQQEQADARANGGYITQSQKQQLNGEENQLRQQINTDLAQ